MGQQGGHAFTPNSQTPEVQILLSSSHYLRLLSNQRHPSLRKMYLYRPNWLQRHKLRQIVHASNPKC